MNYVDIDVNEDVVFPEASFNTVKSVIDKVIEIEKLPFSVYISVMIVSGETIREINATERNIDKVTDVLSFPGAGVIAGEIVKIKNYPFDIDEGVYAEWCSLLREHIKPQLMLCGHIHEAYISKIGCEKDYNGQPCTVVVASKMNKKVEGTLFYGGAITLYEDSCNVKITNEESEILIDENIDFDIGEKDADN